MEHKIKIPKLLSVKKIKKQLKKQKPIQIDLMNELYIMPNFIDYIKWTNWCEYVRGSNGTNNNS